MKRILFLTLLILGFYCSNAQIIINELTADAGNNDGTGGDWIEFKNIDTLPVDMSCWRLTNGGSVIITIPLGLVVPPGGYLLIGNASKMMCNTCDHKSMNLLFSLNPDGYGTGVGIFSNTVFLNSDLLVNGGCGCLTGSGNYNSGNGTGDRVVLYTDAGAIVDAMMYAGGSNYGGGLINVNFTGTPTCSVSTLSLPAVSDPIYIGRTICNDLKGCSSSFARLPDGNNNAIVTYDQSGNLSCTGCQNPCGVGAFNTASTNNPTPGFDNSLSANTWSASLNASTITSTTTNMTVCGATPITFAYTINNYINAALTAVQGSSNLGSYVSINGGTPTNFSSTNYNVLNGVTTLSSTVTPPNGITTYEFVWGDGNSNCTTCPGSTSLSVPTSPLSPEQECYIYHKLIVTREDALGGTPTATCSLPGSITVNGATGTNIQYTLQKQSVTGGPFVTVAGPFTSNIIGGIYDDDADPTLPNYRVLVSSVNTVCTNPTPLVVLVPNACLGNPACPKYVTSGSGAPTFTPSNGSNVCAGSTVQFTVNITGVCTTGQVDVMYDYNPLFDPYISGTLLGSVGTTVGATPAPVTATGKVFINEFVVRPGQGTCPGSPDANNPNSGEWVELYNAGPGNVDISGWILADGDWTGTIPAGTTLNSGLHYLIGGGGTFCSTGVLPDLNLETCNCATLSPSTSDMMNLTNNGEQLALFDCSGTFIDGVLWASGQAIPDTTANIAPATGCGNYIPQKSVNLPAAASYASSGTISSPNSGKYRTSANAWVTTTVTTISPKATNPGGNWNGITGTPAPFGTQCPPPPVTATITVTLPDTCSQTNSTPITLKAIYKPTPISPCTNSDVTASASFTIPACELLTMTGGGDYCSPDSALITLNTSSPLVNNYNFTLSNGTNTVSIPGATGPGPFTAYVLQSGNWKVSGITPPSGVCPPKSKDSAIVTIHPIPIITSAPTSASFCNQYNFDLASLNANIVTNPPTSQFVWYDSATGGSPIFTIVNPSVATTYYVAATTGAPSNCEESVRTAIQLNIDPVPEVPAVNCNGLSATFIPQSPNCTPTPCATGLEYSVDGTLWSAGPTFTATDPGWAGFGSPSNSVVYMRNAANPACFTYVTYFSPCLNPLPTELFNFYGKLNSNNSVDLKWQTAQEKNVSHFEIEKSADKITFSKIGSVAAKGNTSEISTYLFNDPMAFNGSNYYRLKIVDINHEFAYSNIIVIESAANASSITNLYPNPAKDKLIVQLNLSKEEKGIFQIIDIMGHIVSEETVLLDKGLNTKKINVQSLAKGRYTMRLVMNSNTLNKGFVKE